MTVVLTLLIVPLLVLLVDVLAQFRAAHSSRVSPKHASRELLDLDYTIVVPIYGNIKYLENTDYLQGTVAACYWPPVRMRRRNSTSACRSCR